MPIYFVWVNQIYTVVDSHSVVYIYIYIYIHTHTHIYIYIYIYIYRERERENFRKVIYVHPKRKYGEFKVTDIIVGNEIDRLGSLTLVRQPV